MNNKSIKGVIYRTLNDFDKSEAYLRGLALNQTEYKLEITDESLKNRFGILKIDMDVSTDSVSETCIGEFNVHKIKYYCSTKLISSTIDTYYLEAPGVDIEIHIVEIDEEHKGKKNSLCIFDGINKYHFDVDLHDVNLKFSIAFNLNKMEIESLEHIQSIGLAQTSLMFVLDWKNCKEKDFMLIRYIYTHYTCPILLFVYLPRLNDVLTNSVIKKLYWAANGMNKRTPRFNVEACLDTNIDDTRWVYKKDIVNGLSEFYNCFDSFEVSPNNSIFVRKSL